jgi:hypothetical protein
MRGRQQYRKGLISSSIYGSALQILASKSTSGHWHFQWVAPSHTPFYTWPASSFPASGKGSRRGQTLEGHFGDANKWTERNRQCNTVHAVSKMFWICDGVRIHQVKRKQRPNTCTLDQPRIWPCDLHAWVGTGPQRSLSASGALPATWGQCHQV